MKEYFKVIQPHDNLSIVGDRKACIAAVLYLGEGWYGLNDDKGEEVMPLMIGDAKTALQWIELNLGMPLLDYLKSNKSSIADALNSVAVGDRYAYELYLSNLPPDGIEAGREKWDDEHRTSMSTVALRAYELAKAFSKADGDAA